MPIFKDHVTGGWINGKWRPNGAEAAMNGTALPEAPKPKAPAPAPAPAAPAKAGDKK